MKLEQEIFRDPPDSSASGGELLNALRRETRFTNDGSACLTKYPPPKRRNENAQKTPTTSSR
jgi:hypothetical protein